MPYDRQITMEGVRIIFRNFAGKEGQFNREGDRSFAVVLEDPNLVQQLERDGWNVKYLKPREDGEEPQPYLEVAVGYKIRAPKIFQITSRGKTPLGENEVEILDWVDIQNVDLKINPYDWEVSGKTGIKAYLDTMYITIIEDELDLKYADLDNLPARSGRVDEV